MKTFALAFLALIVTTPSLMAQEMATDKDRPQIKYSSFIQLRGRVAGRDAYVNEAGTFAAIRIVTWSRAGKNAKTGKPTFKAHFTSVVAFGDQVELLASLKKKDRILIQGQLDMIPAERRYKGKNGKGGDTHRVIARYIEQLPEKKVSGGSK